MLDFCIFKSMQTSTNVGMMVNCDGEIWYVILILNFDLYAILGMPYVTVIRKEGHNIK